MDQIEKLVNTIFRGDWAAYLVSLPARRTIELGDGRWCTEER